MINQLLNILASIIVLAMISVALSRKSNTQGVISSFFTGFGTTIKNAGNAGR